MKDHLVELVRSSPTPAHGRNVMREYLQARILGALQRAGAMIPLAFHGGTALRFLYAIARYSEVLDFALERDKKRYEFRAYLQAIKSELAVEGYAVERFERLKIDRYLNKSEWDPVLSKMILSPSIL